MTLLQIRTGRIQEYPDSPRPLDQRNSQNTSCRGVTVTSLCIEGDEQADQVNHGGPDKAILCYAREHYVQWSLEPGIAAPPVGTLRENFEVDGANEEKICIGDVFQIAEAVMQIGQPRQPCWNPAQLHRLPHLTAQMLKTGRTGWYLSVLQGGCVNAPADMHLLKRPYPEWTVAHATRVMHVQKDAALRAELAKFDALSAAGKTALTGS